MSSTKGTQGRSARAQADHQGVGDLGLQVGLLDVDLGRGDRRRVLEVGRHVGREHVVELVVDADAERLMSKPVPLGATFLPSDFWVMFDRS